MIHVIRISFLLVVLAISISFASTEPIAQRGAEYVTLYVLIPVAAALGVILLDMFWRRKQLHVLSGLFFGLLAGLLIAYILTLIVGLVANLFPAPPRAEDPGPPPVAPLPGATTQEMETHLERVKQYQSREAAYEKYMGHVNTIQLIKFLLGAASVFLCVTIVFQTKDEFRFVIPYVEFAKQAKGARPLLLDTSVIIDGRISDICDTRIIDAELVVPRFILHELQTIADSDDRLKRNRGRRGLDVLNALQKSEKVDVRIVETRLPREDESADVDARLVSLAKHLDGRVITNDYNLNKIAQLRGVEVININDLANALKPIVLPGETMSVQVIKRGAEPGQGVGYLEDGTMVVVEQGRDHLNREVTITVTSVLQTSAGRMIFGKMDANKTFASADRNPRVPKAQPEEPKA